MKRINNQFRRTEPAYKEKTLSPAAIQALRRYDWPGNIRELNSILTELSVFSDSGEIGSSDIQLALKTRTLTKEMLLNRDQGEQINLTDRLKEIKQRFINEALQETNGNQSKAAKLLGVTQQSLSWQTREVKRSPI